jgi:4-amino-4-deoxy-L-arabinose transferase-like glycosyltransferase
VALGLAALTLVMTGVVFHPTPYSGGDNGAYYALARSIAEGRGYVELWDPAQRPHAQYPPVFPAILAAGMLLGAHTWAAFKMIVAVFAAAAVAFSYLWVQRTSTAGVALAAGVLMAICPGVLEYAHLELSDVPFWAFTMLAFWAFAHLDRPGEAGDSADSATEPRAGSGDAWRTEDAMPDVRWAAAAILATGLAHFTRSAGLPLLVAAAVWLVMRRRFRTLVGMVGVIGPFLVVWGIRGARMGAPGYLGVFRYLDPYQPSRGPAGIRDLLVRIAINVQRYLGEYVGVLMAGADTGLVLGAVAGVLVIAGWWRAARRRVGIAELWLPMYVGLLLLWPPTWSGERFLIPMLPMGLRYAGEAVRDLGARLGSARIAGSLVTAALAIAMLPALGRQAEAGTVCRAEAAAGRPYSCIDQPWQDFFVLAEAVKGRLPAGTAVISRKPMIFYAVAGYPGRMYPLSAVPDTFFAAARQARAEYVVVDQISDLAPMYLHPILLARRDDFCVIAQPRFENAALARITPGAPPRPPNSPPNAFRACTLPPPR